MFTSMRLNTLEVTALAGGSSEGSDKLPMNTEITKRIALAVRDSGAAKNGCRFGCSF